MQRPALASSSAPRMPSGERPPLKLSTRGRTKLAISPRQVPQSRGLDRLEQLPQDGARVADQPDGDGHVLADLRRIELDVDHLRPAGEGREVSRHPVIEPEPDPDDQVGLLDGAVHVHLAMHARHAQVQRVRLRERADPEQRGDDRNAGPLGERPELVVGVAQDDAVPGHDERPLGSADQPDGLDDRHRRRASHQAGPPRFRRARRGLGAGQLLVLHVLRHVEQHGTRPAFAGHRERLVDRVRQLLDVLDQPAVLGDRLGDPDDVGLLEGVPPDHRAGHLTGDRHQRRVVHVGRGDPGHQVRRPRSRGRDAHAGTSAGPRIPVRRVGRRLLVPHQHVAQRGILGQRVVERHDRAARVAEHQLDALVLQGPAEDLRAGQQLLRHHTPHR